MDAERLRQSAHVAALGGLRRGEALQGIERDVARCRARGVYEPDLAMLELVIAALDYAHVAPTNPLDTSDWRERFLPEVNFRNKHVEVQRLTYALHVAAAFRTGLHSDILSDTYGWGGSTLLPYATRAAVMTIRAVAHPRPIAAVCDEVAPLTRRLQA